MLASRSRFKAASSSVFVPREKERVNRSSLHYTVFLKHISSILALDLD